jgi:hypothetical protein
MEEFIDMLKGFRDVKVIKIGEEKAYDETHDNADKELGDSVEVISKISVAYMHDFDTKIQLAKEHNIPENMFEGMKAVVIDTETDFIFNCGHCDEEHKSDLVIYFPKLQKKYHISSNLVKLI